jgi:hypothetical protein
MRGAAVGKNCLKSIKTVFKPFRGWLKKTIAVLGEIPGKLRPARLLSVTGDRWESVSRSAFRLSTRGSHPPTPLFRSRRYWPLANYSQSL